MITLIGDRVVNCLARNDISPKSVKLNVNMADGSLVEISKAYEFPCIINEQNHHIKSLFLPILSTPLVFGMDVIQALNLITVSLPNSISCNQRPISQDICHTSVISQLTEEEIQKLGEFLNEELLQFQEIRDALLLSSTK